MVLRFEDLVQPVARGEAGVHQVEELATEVRRHTVAPGWVEPDDVFPASPPPPWRRLRRLVDQLVGVATAGGGGIGGQCGETTQVTTKSITHWNKVTCITGIRSGSHGLGAYPPGH